MDYPGKVITKTQVTPTQTSASGNWTLDDQAAAIKNNNWPVALVPNPISKSLRFNSADSAYLNRTVAAAATSNTLTTLSFWFKRAKLGTSQQLFASATSAPNVACYIELTTSDTLKIYLDMTAGGSDETTWTTSAVFRDVSAWYGATIKVDTSQASNANKVLLYINGVSQTLTASQTGTAVSTQRILENGISLTIGKYFNSSGYGDFYLTEFYCIDGQALTPSSFGMTNPQTGQWIPLKYSGTYGTNGFYLNFKDATSTTTLGYDYSGNANNWTTNNFSVTAGSGNDSLTDVPTPWVAYNTTGDVGGVIRGNYATLNPLIATATLSNGNLDFSQGNTKTAASMGVTSGKWYCEAICNTTANRLFAVGVAKVGDNSAFNLFASGVGYYADDGSKYVDGTNSAYGATYTAGDTIGIALNMDAGTVTFYKNNTSQGSISLPTSSQGYYPLAIQAGSGSTSATWSINFGQRPFAYTPPAGFRSLCTTNLPATTIGFGLTNQGDDYFNAVLYAGTSLAQSITGVGFQPDLVWGKNRTNVNGHRLTDVLRGVGKVLFTDTTNGDTTGDGQLSSFDANGFSLTGGAGAFEGLNQSGNNYVAWNWKAGGTGVTNTSGTITSTVSANTTAGFSVVTYTGTGSSPQSIGHGLGATPAMIILKSRSSTSDWYVNHVSIGTNDLRLNSTSASAANNFFSAKSSTTFTINFNQTGNWVAYCFAAVAGYSAFGSYTGNGSATGDGPFVYLGFRPRYVLAKVASNQINATNWQIWDALRPTYNVASDYLFANSSDAESNSAPTYHAIDFLSNGFKLRCVDTYGFNQSGAVYIYAAFAESPFQFSNAR